MSRAARLDALRPLALALCLLPGCAQEEPALGPPEGWQAEGDRWWRAGADTASAFADVEALVEAELAETKVPPSDQVRAALVRAVQDELRPLYGNRPAVVDSLFGRYALPILLKAPAPTQATFNDHVRRLYRESYYALARHFREPRQQTRLEEVGLVYPDSLRDRGVGGTVVLRVRLDEQGAPVAIRRLESAGPTLDALALRATAALRWSPAYLNQDPIPAWVRFTIPFRPPGEAASGG